MSYVLADYQIPKSFVKVLTSFFSKAYQLIIGMYSQFPMCVVYSKMIKIPTSFVKMLERRDYRPHEKNLENLKLNCV